MSFAVPLLMVANGTLCVQKSYKLGFTVKDRESVRIS